MLTYSPEKFASLGIENHLGDWTKPMRTLSRIKGRSGVPTFKKRGPDIGWRVEYSGTGFSPRSTKWIDLP